MKSLKQLFTEYKSQHKALPAFNVDSFEIYQAVESAVAETQLPCIVQLSESEDKFIHAERLLMLVKKAQIDGLPIYLNMDHNKNIDRLEKLTHLGFDMVHFDGSDLDYEVNLQQATDLIQKIKNQNLNTLIEVEFNPLTENNFTDPTQAKNFMDKTSADLLAVSIGNRHGADPKTPEKLDLDLLKQIGNILSPNQFLTLHGGSGIDADQISSAINLGIVKININTDLRLKFKESINNALSSIQSEKIYEYLTPVVDDLKAIIIKKLQQFTL